MVVNLFYFKLGLIPMAKQSQLTRKIVNVFLIYETIRLGDLYALLSEDAELKNIRHIEHKIRGSIYHLKKQGKVKSVSGATYQYVK